VGTFNIGDIPAHAVDITISLDAVSFAGATPGDLYMRVGNSGGLITSGYNSGASWTDTGNTCSSAISTSYFPVAFQMPTAGSFLYGRVQLLRARDDVNIWTIHADGYSYNDARTFQSSGHVYLTTKLTQIEFYVISGRTFDAGQGSILIR